MSHVLSIQCWSSLTHFTQSPGLHTICIYLRSRSTVVVDFPPHSLAISALILSFLFLLLTTLCKYSIKKTSSNSFTILTDIYLFTFSYYAVFSQLPPSLECIILHFTFSAANHRLYKSMSVRSYFSVRATVLPTTADSSAFNV